MVGWLSFINKFRDLRLLTQLYPSPKALSFSPHPLTLSPQGEREIREGTFGKYYK
jgi:hypothetical protein